MEETLSGGKRMRVLVTGGAGFVGSFLVDELERQKHKVTVIDDLSTGKYENMGNHDFFFGDVSKFKWLSPRFDVVFHLAASPYSKTNVDWFTESDSVYQSNVFGVYNILRLMNPKSHFILVSSASVYGSGRHLREENGYNAQSAYGYSKILAEQITLNSHRFCSIVRPGTIIGVNGRCFPNLVMWSLLKRKKLEFFNGGENVRDLVDVRDVAFALTKIMDEEVRGVFNLGSNSEVTGNQLIALAKEVGRENKLEFRGKVSSFVPKDFVKESTLDSDKIMDCLGWKPVYKLKGSLEDIFNHYKKNYNAYEPPSWEVI